MNLDQQWTYIEADTVCDQCGVLFDKGCDCPNRGKACGGPGYFVTMTEREILRTFYEYWRGEMVKAGKLDEITPENCIQDWVVVNWAAKGGPEAFSNGVI